eukprot:COSAG02_NODE_6902_length_3297_cov_92.257067_4_plen_93_part_01
MISQFFVVSPRGDTLIFKDYRGDVSRNTSEKFWRHVKFSKGAAEPVFVSQALPAEWRAGEGAQRGCPRARAAQCLRCAVADPNVRVCCAVTVH